MLKQLSKIQIAIAITFLLILGGVGIYYVVQEAPVEFQTGKAKPPKVKAPVNPNQDSGKGGTPGKNEGEKEKKKGDGCDQYSCPIR